MFLRSELQEMFVVLYIVPGEALSCIQDIRTLYVRRVFNIVEWQLFGYGICL